MIPSRSQIATAIATCIVLTTTSCKKTSPGSPLSDNNAYFHDAPHKVAALSIDKAKDALIEMIKLESRMELNTVLSDLESDTPRCTSAGQDSFGIGRCRCNLTQRKFTMIVEQGPPILIVYSGVFKRDKERWIAAITEEMHATPGSSPGEQTVAPNDR